jgi:hypothetical protein
MCPPGTDIRAPQKPPSNCLETAQKMKETGIVIFLDSSLPFSLPDFFLDVCKGFTCDVHTPPGCSVEGFLSRLIAGTFRTRS